MEATFNYTKYLDKNPLQKLLIRRFFSVAISMLKDQKISNILDVGCGEGVALAELCKGGIGATFTGIDYSKDSVLFAKKLYPKFHFVVGNIYELPYGESKFDLVVAMEVLEHLDDPRKAVCEIERVTKKYCLISVPNEPIFRIANFLRGRYWGSFGSTPGHIQHWSKVSFISFLQTQGMHIINVQAPFPWIVVLTEKR